MALDVADEVHARLLEEVVGLSLQVPALALLVSDVEDPHPGTLLVEVDLGEGTAHDPELVEVLGPALDVGAAVEHDDAPRGDHQVEVGDGRPMYSRQPPDQQRCRSDGGTGRTGRVEAVHLAVGDQAGGHRHGGVLLLANRGPGILTHPDGGRGVHDRQVGARIVEDRLQHCLVADQHDADSALGRLDAAVHDLERRMVAAHGVECDACHLFSRWRRLLDRCRCRTRDTPGGAA